MLKGSALSRCEGLKFIHNRGARKNTYIGVNNDVSIYQRAIIDHIHVVAIYEMRTGVNYICIFASGTIFRNNHT